MKPGHIFSIEVNKLVQSANEQLPIHESKKFEHAQVLEPKYETFVASMSAIYC